MIGKTVHERICEMWPRAAAAGPAWAREYMRILKPFEGEPLQKAWDDWMAKNDEGMPPKPRDLAKLCVEATRGGGLAPTKQGLNRDEEGPRHGERNALGQTFIHGNWYPLTTQDRETWTRAYHDLMTGPDGAFKPKLRAIAEKVFERDKEFSRVKQP